MRALTTARRRGEAGAVPYAIYGRQQLSTMVAADEALVLLWMMTCSSTIEYNGKMVRGFSLVEAAEG